MNININFDYESISPDAYLYALLPQFWSKIPQSDNIQVVIIRSKNWKDNNTYIVGLYLFPQFKGHSPVSEFPIQDERVVNLKTNSKNVVLLDNFIQLTSTNQRILFRKVK
mgnify:CR=1 FL=1